MLPRLPDLGIATPGDFAACRALLGGGSRTFFTASLVLPHAVREPATALYAFCRLADDAIDLDGSSLDALARLRERLDRVYEGRPVDVAADRAFAEVVARFGIPRALPEALLEGFEWDASGRCYADLAGLYAYAARVAGTVGAMMAILMGVRAPEAIARACDLGVAMQLTNIARDVGEDARAGRLYLPLAWLTEAGIDPQAWLARPTYSVALGAVIRRLLAAADVLYERAQAGIPWLPLPCRPAMFAARFIYAEIGRELERSGLDSITRRAVVPGLRKARLLLRALSATALPGKRAPAPPLAETRFLVEAVAGAPAPLPKHSPAWSNFTDRVVWVIELFERLERRDREKRVAFAIRGGGR